MSLTSLPETLCAATVVRNPAAEVLPRTQSLAEIAAVASRLFAARPVKSAREHECPSPFRCLRSGCCGVCQPPAA